MWPEGENFSAILPLDLTGMIYYNFLGLRMSPLNLCCPGVPPLFMKKTRLFLEAVLCPILGLSLLFWGCSEKKPPPPPPVPVVAATVAQKDVPVQLKTIGNVEAYATVAVKARVGGEIKQVNFKEGQDVKAGALLFVIDPRPLEAALRDAQARLARDKALAKKAETDAVRYSELVQKEFVSREQYDQAQATAESLTATVAADEAAVENARVQLSYCFITSPLNGRTGNLKADQGNLIKADADTSMVVINQIQPIYVSFSVPEQFLPEIKKYMAAEKIPVKAVISKDDKQEELEEGVLTFVNNTVDTTTGTILCKATYDNRDKRLWPGLFVNVVMTFTTEKGAVAVPSQAIQTGQEGQFVFVVKPDLTVEARPVEVGRTFNGEVVVKKGLEAGERVVTDGQLRLVPGAKVEVKQPEAGAKAS
jgi:multidrug efflux system membrane fusion protein